VGRHSAAEVVPTTRSGRFGHRTRSGFNAFILYVAPVVAFVGWNGEFELADGKVIGTAFAYDWTDPAMRAGTKVAALDPSGSLDTAFPRQWNWAGW
jgi:hypothetical protein